MPAGESNWTNTQERFHETPEKHTRKKKSKKKNTESKESIVLQTLQNVSLNDKEVNDDTTHHSQHSSSSSPPRHNNMNINNSSNQEDIQPSKAKPKSKRALPSRPLPDEAAGLEAEDLQDARRTSKKGKRKEVGKGDREVEHGGHDNDELLLQYQQQMVPEDDIKAEDSVNDDTGKKKKKKPKSVTTESEAGDHGQDADVEHDSKKKKKKKKSSSAVEEDGTEAAPKKPVTDDGLVLGVYVHRTDCLKTDLRISHPMVKVHLVDEVTGQYVMKEDSHRPVSSFYEQDRVDHILPIMTQPFDFKKNKTVIPEWQEQIIFNEPFGHFVQQDSKGPNVILFFEILDFLSMEEAKANVDVDVNERGFRKIAWAFLKLVGANGVLNAGSKLRLQLYCLPTWVRRQPGSIEVVEWWRHYPRVKYASTLYVTVKGIKIPQHVDPSIRSMMALQEERGSTSYSELQDGATKRMSTPHLEDKPTVLKWSRLPGQVCRIPNKPMLAFRGGQMGCLTVLFSHAGTLLAAACADRDTFPVVVFEIPSGKVLAAFSGHLKIVYELCWSSDDTRLLSASSDGTVREWNVDMFLPNARKVLPHPSFVYSAQYHPTAQNLAVSGGYDYVLRLWRLDVDEVNGQLLREFEAHGSFINTVCFDAAGQKMFSADNTGSIIAWNTSVSGRQPWRHWSVEKNLAEEDLKGVPINMLQVHSNGRCLLIHAKDNILRTMDLRIWTVKTYVGATNHRERIYSTFTPCGSFIFSGSEDGMAYVWNTETGDQLAVYSELCYSSALCGVSFHPHDNMVAFCAFGEGQPVHVYLHDRKVSQLDVHSMKELGSTSADTRTTRNTPDPLHSTSASSAVDQFSQAARLALKLQRVKEQMDSVLEPHHRSSSGYEPVTGRSLLSDMSVAVLPSYNPRVDPPHQMVVSLYDYKANRSDELTLRRGDVIRVLYKDNENWWFGSLADGQQGYFLVAYVEDHRDSAEDAVEGHTVASEGTVERATPTRISAAITASGELRFLSEPTLSDTEPEATEAKLKKKRKVKKPSSEATLSDPDVAETDGRRLRPVRRPLPKRPSRRAGAALQLDA
ncbi:jouberin isoform X2 [Dunckerocampus dactyliophorus]|uniref:jouberin isoform X2 n=1 Tax=Dunckerocampus dactyliophorus TaxID=161453 RepID=UPI00240578C0|nr:jouberin isoform X2 [Dunckerocampus dactyliophorus]